MASDIAMMAAYAPSQEFLEWSQSPHPHDYSILHELNLMTEKIDSPAASQESLPVPHPKKRSGPGMGSFPAKTELLYATTLPTSPVTEDEVMRSTCPPVLPPLPSSHMQSNPTPVALKARDGRIIKSETPCPLPTPSKNQAAARRALRREARKRQRHNYYSSSSSSSSASPAASSSTLPNVMPHKAGGTSHNATQNTTANLDSSSDKKFARVIRNRAAAAKSRVQAKQKMYKLERDNERLSKTVDQLTASNKILAAQIKALTRSLSLPPVQTTQQQILSVTAAQMQAGPTTQHNNNNTTTPTKLIAGTNRAGNNNVNINKN